MNAWVSGPWISEALQHQNLYMVFFLATVNKISNIALRKILDNFPNHNLSTTA